MFTNDDKKSQKVAKSRKNSQKLAKTRKCYECKICDYKTFRSNDYIKHLKTKLHKKREMMTNDDKNSQKLAESIKEYECEICRKTYSTRQSLYVHKKTCSLAQNEANTISIKEMYEMMMLLINNQNQQTNIISDISKTQGNNNNNNNNNKNFNIQLFLNEDCKNAISLLEFAKSIPIFLEDLELFKSDYIGTLKNKISGTLTNYPETTRPIHSYENKMYYKKEDATWDTEKQSGDIITKTINNEVSRKKSTYVNEIFKENINELSPKEMDVYTDYMRVSMKTINGRENIKILKEMSKECKISI